MADEPIDPNAELDPVQAGAQQALGDTPEVDPFDAALESTASEMQAKLQADSDAAKQGGNVFTQAMDVLNSAGLGILKGGIEMANTAGDIVGLPQSTYDKQSPIIHTIMADSAELNRRSGINAVSEGIGQFAVGLIGAGKALQVVRVGQLAVKGGTAGKLAYETIKGAAAAGTAFDPHQERLSNLIENVPALRNPINGFLAADPDDSNAMGRLKNALEGAGMDLVTAGVLSQALKVYRAAASVARGAGDEAGLTKAAEELANTVKGRSPGTGHMGDDQIAPTDPLNQKPAPADAGPAAPKPGEEPANAGGTNDQAGVTTGPEGAPAQAGAPTAVPNSGKPIQLSRPAKPEAPTGTTIGGTPSTIERPKPDAGYPAPAGIKPGAKPKAAPQAKPATSELGDALKSRAKETGVKAGTPAAKMAKSAAAKVIMDKPKIVTNGIGYSIVPKDEMHVVGKEWGIDSTNFLGAADKKTGRIWIRSDVLDLPPKRQAEIIAHETGHVLETHMLERMGKGTGKDLKTLPAGIRDEMVAASKLLRAKTWEQAHLAKYVNSTSELFADAFALWKTNRKLFGETAPHTAKLFDTHFEPWIDHDFTTHGGDLQAALDDTLHAETQAAAPPVTPGYKPTVIAEVDDAQRLVDDYNAGQAAIKQHGSREAAEAAGFKFPSGSLPWQKLNGSQELQDFTEQVAATFKSTLDDLKGGDVLHDARVNALVAQRVQLFNEDPNLLMGVLQQAGHQANSMVADMEAAFAVANKAGSDLFTLVKNNKVGNYVEFGGDEQAANAALPLRLAAFVEAMGNAQAMRAASGRAMRRMRGEFAVTPAQLEYIRKLTPEQITNTVELAGGDPKMLSKMAQQGFWERHIRAAGSIFSNNLLWLWPTHVRNLLGNAFMLSTSPAMRAVGSFGLKGGGADVRSIAMREYRYMASSISDAGKAAVDTYLKGDSTISPHSNEFFRDMGTNMPTSSAGRLGLSVGFKPLVTVGDAFHNMFAAMHFTITQPNRVLGMSDEFIKQMSYRGSVLAKASLKADDLGLQGKDYTDFLSAQLEKAFDGAGRALDKDALYDAQVRTFNQPLLPTTIGKGFATIVSQHPTLRFIFPFVRTPINLFRYAIKMSPGLNLLQKEYQRMISGELGPQRQADAYGQMALGSMLVGSTVLLAHSGMITGGGPSDPGQKKALADTGWKPYSFLSTDAAGNHTYVPFNQLDPAGMVLGMVADIAQVQQQAEVSDQTIDKMVLPAMVAIAKNLMNRSYLQSLSNTIDAMSDPDRSMARMAGSTLSAAVPFSSLLREVNPDPYLRDARGIIDSVLANIPGFSDKLPPRRDVFGAPVKRVINMVFGDNASDIADAEQQRMLTNFGIGLTPLAATQKGGVDLREVDLPNGQTAFDRYQELIQKPQGKRMTVKAAVAKVIQSPSYQRMADGPASLQGTKLWALTKVLNSYREIAYKQLLRENPDLAKATGAQQQAVREAYRNAGNKQDGQQGQASAYVSSQLRAANRAFGVK